MVELFKWRDWFHVLNFINKISVCILNYHESCQFHPRGPLPTRKAFWPLILLFGNHYYAGLSVENFLMNAVVSFIGSIDVRYILGCSEVLLFLLQQ